MIAYFTVVWKRGHFQPQLPGVCDVMNFTGCMKLVRPVVMLANMMQLPSYSAALVGAALCFELRLES